MYFIRFLKCCVFCLPVTSSIVELTSPSESGAPGSRLPANLLLNLVPLTLVCLQHCASTTSWSVALEVNNVDSTSGIALIVNKHLFEAVVGLLVAVPEIVKDMLSLMQKIMSGVRFFSILNRKLLFSEFL